MFSAEESILHSCYFFKQIKQSETINIWSIIMNARLACVIECLEFIYLSWIQHYSAFWKVAQNLISMYFITKLLSKKAFTPSSGLTNHSIHWKLWELISGDLIKENIFHFWWWWWWWWLEIDLKQECEKQGACIWEEKQKLVECED